MLKLEQQVCSLELAKRLKQLGVKQESYFKWLELVNGWVVDQIDGDVSAFTVAELGGLLPRRLQYDVSEDGYRHLEFSSGRTIMNDGWYVMYSDPHPANKVPIHTEHADTEADARAKMLCYLLLAGEWGY